VPCCLPDVLFRRYRMLSIRCCMHLL
jgi:hypothetical protein